MTATTAREVLALMRECADRSIQSAPKDGHVHVARRAWVRLLINIEIATGERPTDLDPSALTDRARRVARSESRS